jgi:hypothetical protein
MIMTQYVGFSPRNLDTIRNDVNAAKQLAQRCANALTYGPGNPSFKLMTLLSDTFMVPVRDWDAKKNWDKAGNLRMRFGSFGERIDKAITFAFSEKSPNKPGEMDAAAFVKKDQLNTIYLTPRYFNTAIQKQRCALLIHEFVHTILGQTGHPGGIKVIFGGQTHMGIPFDMSFNNPYCYQYFAEWL